MCALRATAEARAWTTEIVERECVSVTPSVPASKLIAGRAGTGHGTGTGHVVLSSISRQISTSPTRLSSVLTRSANSRWAGRIRSGHIHSDTFSRGRDRRQTRAAGSVGRAASLPPLQSPIPKPDETWDKGTSWQLVLRSWHTIPRPPRDASCGQNLPAGKDLAETKEAFCWWWGSVFT